jgi:hypothetical protein
MRWGGEGMECSGVECPCFPPFAFTQKHAHTHIRAHMHAEQRRGHGRAARNLLHGDDVHSGMGRPAGAESAGRGKAALLCDLRPQCPSVRSSTL